jgi:hypothetical protein
MIAGVGPVSGKNPPPVPLPPSWAESKLVRFELAPRPPVATCHAKTGKLRKLIDIFRIIGYDVIVAEAEANEQPVPQRSRYVKA